MTVTQAVALQANGAVRSNEARLQQDELKHATCGQPRETAARDRTVSVTQRHDRVSLSLSLSLWHTPTLSWPPRL